MKVNGETLVASQIISYAIITSTNKPVITNSYVRGTYMAANIPPPAPIYSESTVSLTIQIRTAHPELIIETTIYPEGTNLTEQIATKEAELTAFINPTITL